MGVAIVMRRTGGPEVLALEARDDPGPGPDEILIRNAAIGLNFIDIYQRKGLYPVALPAVLGSEGAGVVVATGENARAFRAGERIAYLASGGAYATASLAPQGLAAKIPDGVSDDVAAAAFLKGLTALMLVADVHALKAGETALVHAAAGGVGTLLVQMAVKRQARVIAVVGDGAKAARARAAGASDVIVRGKGISLAADVRALTEGRGVDVVYDSVGAATFEASLDCLALRGHMVSYGNASGAVPAVLPLDLTRRGSLTLSRPSLFHYATPDRLPAMAKTLFSMIERGELRVEAPRVFSLAHAEEAHALLEGGATTGAIVLKP